MLHWDRFGQRNNLSTLKQWMHIVLALHSGRFVVIMNEYPSNNEWMNDWTVVANTITQHIRVLPRTQWSEVKKKSPLKHSMWGQRDPTPAYVTHSPLSRGVSVNQTGESVNQKRESVNQTGESVNQTHPMWGQRDPTPVCYNSPLSRGTSVNQTGTGSLNQRQKVLCGAWVWVWCKTVISKQSGYHKTSCKTVGLTTQHTSLTSLDTMQQLMQHWLSLQKTLIVSVWIPCSMWCHSVGINTCLVTASVPHNVM